MKSSRSRILPTTKIILAGAIITVFAWLVLGRFSATTPTKGQFENTTGRTVAAYNSYTNFAFSSYYDLKILNHEPFPKPRTSIGGGIESINSSQLLLVDGAGQILILDRIGDQLTITALPSPEPLLNPEFLQRHPQQEPQWYRVTDTLLTTTEQPLRLYVSYTHWDPNEDCFSIGIAETRIDVQKRETSPWITRYRTKPCLAWQFLGNETGGRLEHFDEGHLLLTVGVQGVDTSTWLGENSGDYGKILLLDSTQWDAEVFSSGHRNPQGLLVEPGLVWETEHGPFGGDELNIIKFGNDYGWPRYSYGTDYGKKDRSEGLAVGEHSGTSLPFYSWSPSIGVSNLVRITGEAFSKWRGDLLIGSLYGNKGGRSLYRIRILDQRAVVSEQIETRRPIRDLVEMPGGELALWDGRSTVQIVSPGNHIMAECASCHPVQWHEHAIGPQLIGVVGNDIARHKDFKYSPGMSVFPGRWTPELLNRFLEDPAGTIPGTSMDFPGIKDHKKRWQIISYLKSSRPPESGD